MPLHTAASTPRRATLTRTAIIVVAAGIAAGGTAIAVSDGQTAPPDRSTGAQFPPAIGHYDDIEANKAASMRALGLHITQKQTDPASRYQDLEANKARSRPAR